MTLKDLRARLPAGFTVNHSRLGFRAMVAAVASYGLAVGLSLPNGYWAVLTAVLVVQSSLGASLAVALDRVVGTLAGGAIGVACAMLAGPSAALTFVYLAVGVFLGSTLAARNPRYKLAPVTVCIVMLANPTHDDALVSGLHRILEIGVGGGVGLLCALLVLPARALTYLFPNAARALEACAGLLELGTGSLLGRGLDPAALDALNAEARNTLRAADVRATEARAERAGWLASHGDPAPTVRTCRRLWHSVIILLRAASPPLPEDLARRIAPSLEAASSALAARMRALAGLMRSGDSGAPEDGDAAAAAVAGLQTAVEELNASGALDAAGGPTLAALYSALSACVQVRENLDDLAARLEEMRAGEA